MSFLVLVSVVWCVSVHVGQADEGSAGDESE